MGIDFCVHNPFLSHHKGSHAPTSGSREKYYMYRLSGKKKVKCAVEAERQQIKAKIDKLSRVIESDRKEEISSTEFPEGGNTISTKEPPASQRGNAYYDLLH